MSGREAGLWKWLRLRTSGLGHFSRVESETSPGIPDVHYQVGRMILPGSKNYEIELFPGQGWIELKADKTQKEKYPFRGEDVGLRDSQIIWMTEYLEQGGMNLWVCSALADKVTFHSMRKESDVTGFNLMPRHALISTATLLFDRRGGDIEQQAYSIRKLLT